MAIRFARVARVSRSNGKNACCKGSYNARSKITDQKTNVVYNFINRNDNVYHEILLPKHVDKKFKNPSELMNAIEHIERKNNSQLLKEYVLALPDDKNISLELKKEMLHAFIKENRWVEEGLAVQIDIHEPHDKEKNWHAHLLVTTRRFTKDGQRLGAKARDLDPQVRGGRANTYVKSKEEVNLGNLWKDVQNRIFANHNMENRVDSISLNVQEHVGPVRMRSVMNAAVMRNEERRIAEIEHLNSGVRVLEKVTRHMSIFTKRDIVRAVKSIPDKEAQERLVEDALSDKSIIPLFSSDGNKTKYYTTNEVRLEEQKIMRLSGYVANTENVIGKSGKIFDIASNLSDNVKGGLSQEQHKALKEVLLGNGGLRVLRGRAGVGKSHVLGKLASIADSSGINVIGVAPTHKARIELVKSGYERVDTVKGMLFKLANARFDLPKNSLIVVDEAGMIANSDYQELLRVAATRRCNVILSGDERQLSSVTRGGMFEVFADRYGSSTIFDIQRQDSDWGRSVAQSFANGNVRSGIAILEKEDRLKWHNDAESSMQDLIRDWHKSDYALKDRVILAVKNKDVLALNHGVREYLKQEGKLSGREFSLIDSFYMRGDKILITQTSKELGLLNGDVGEITHLSAYRFTMKFGEKEVSFNPADYNGFRHGYASTVFKSQGASIKDVYVYHDGFSTIRNSYVSLSRHVNELNLYVNKVSTTGVPDLVRQLSNDFENSSSLRYITQAEHAMNQSNEQVLSNMSRIDKMMLGTYEFFEKNITKLADKYIPSSEYYNYVPPKQQNESVAQIMDKTYAENQNMIWGGQHMQEKLVVGGNVLKANNHDKPFGNVLSNVANIDNNNSPPIKGAKSRFYSNADYVRKKENSITRVEQLKAKWNNEALLLRKEVSFKAEQVVRDMLGEANKHLSNGRELRFGDNGKIAVRISGEKAGTWYDFSKGEGGDMFDLVMETKGGDFKEAAQYLRAQVGMSRSSNIKPNLQLVREHTNSDLTKEYIDDKEYKIKYANKLYDRSTSILVGSHSVANRYLSEQRAISCNLSQDIKTTEIYDKEKGFILPALIVFARDKEGNITGGQHILLDKETSDKADIATPKKSFGLISGSFVDLGSSGEAVNSEHKGENIAKSAITIIAEGLETGLSIKQAFREHNKKKGELIKTLCSLGISNIKNYAPYQGQKIIIASDNDGHDSLTNKIIADARQSLTEKGAFVEIVKPGEVGDFNDILRDKSQGEKVIVKSFSGALSRHRATTLAEYFATDNGRFSLSQEEKTKMGYLAQFKINEEKIVNAYRACNFKGKYELNKAIKPIAFAHACVKENMRVIDSANVFGANINKQQLVLSLVGKTSEEIDKHIIETREKHYFRYSLNDLSEDRKKAKTPEQCLKALKAEQDFLASLHDNYAQGIHSKQLIKEINCAYHNEQNNSFNQVHKLTALMDRTEIKTSTITSIIKNSDNSQNALNSLSNKYHGYVKHVINKALDDIDDGMTITSGKKSFICGRKLIDHMLDQNKNNEFFPKEHIQSIRQELTKDHQLQHRFNGPSL